MERGLRVCLLLESYPPVVGGMEAQGQALAEGLAGRGVPVVVLTRRAPADLPPLEAAGGVEVHRVSGSDRWRSVPPVVGRLYRLRDRFDLVYVSGFRVFGVPAVGLAHTLGRKAVLKADNAGELSGAFFDPGLAQRGWSRSTPPVAALNRVRKRVLLDADAFVAISESVRREFLDEGVAPERIRLIPNGVDLTRFRPAKPEGRARLRERLELPPLGLVVVFTGRLVSWKGPLVLLEAWRRLLAAEAATEAALRGPQPRLLFLGSGGADVHACEAEARRFASEHGLGSSVRFLGDVRNVPDFLRAADVFALPTLGDAFPLAPIEAMASGLAVATTWVGGLADYVEDGVNALVVEPQDPAGLHEALARLLGDAELRARLGKEAVRTASRFSHVRVVEEHLALFRELVAQRRGAGAPA